MGPLPLGPEQAEDLDRAGADGAEPVRHPGVELRRLTGREHKLRRSEHHPEPSVEHVQPLISLVGLRIGLAPRPRLDNQLVRLNAAGPPGQRDHRHAVPGHRAHVNARVPGRRRVDKLVERDAVCPGQRQQQLEGGAPLTRFQPGQRAHRDPCFRGNIRQGELPLLTQQSQPGTDICQHGNLVCHLGARLRRAPWPGP